MFRRVVDVSLAHTSCGEGCLATGSALDVSLINPLEVWLGCGLVGLLSGEASSCVQNVNANRCSMIIII